MGDVGAIYKIYSLAMPLIEADRILLLCALQGMDGQEIHSIVTRDVLTSLLCRIPGMI